MDSGKFASNISADVPMQATNPHFLLFSEATSAGRATIDQWRFVLQSLDQDRIFCASDHEPDAAGERLELLAVVRGLEALPEPSRVTLVTKSRYVSHGITRGLEEWRENGWRWERFGKFVAVRDCDLWRRINRALEFHQVECRAWRFNSLSRDESAVSPDLESRELAASVGLPHLAASTGLPSSTTLATEEAYPGDTARKTAPGDELPRALRSKASYPGADGWFSRIDQVDRSATKPIRWNDRLASALTTPWQRISRWFQAPRPDHNWAGAGPA